MKILLVGNYSVDEQHSMLGFVGTLYSGLSSRGIEVKVISPKPVLGKLPLKPIDAAKWLRYIDKYLLFPHSLKNLVGWADLVHICDHGNACYVPYVRHRPHLVTCHDMLAIMSAKGQIEEWSTGTTGKVFQQMIARGLDQAGNVACVSEATRRDLLRASCVPGEQTTVIYNGFYRPCLPMPQSESDPLLERIGLARQEPFLLHVGGNQPYKNRMGVLQIYTALRYHLKPTPMRLVMAGKPFTSAMRTYVQSENLNEAVLERSGLDDDYIRALYSRAKALIFPSLYEGFGLPIIEAQACGCPVFTSNRAPMTEVGGQAAIYFDLTQPQQAARVIADHLDSADEMIAAGKENIRRFATDRMLDDYLATYYRILNCRP
jgi:glycosyltransferase involved in cell wall biosynthesis